MPVSDDLAFASVRTLGETLRSGDVTSVELTRFFLKRLEEHGSTFNAVVTVTRETALQQAEQADRELKENKDRGPLHGIPYGLKDLFATPGIPTSWGAAPLKEQMLDTEATVVTRLKEAGAVLCAKLAMVEIAGGLGYDQANASFTGPGLNPWDTSRWSGGSSSGPGSAVAAGLVPFAIGTETWGSIMSPASACGITGLRPTYGRVSRHGAMALSWTMDKIGPMARTADDCGLILNVLAGPDPHDSSSVDRPYAYPPDRKIEPPFKLATLKGAADTVQPEIRANYEKSLEVLGAVAEFEEIQLPDLPFNTVAGTLIDCEMAAAFEGLVTSGDVWEMTAKEDRYGAHAVLMIPAKDYINAMRIRRHIQQAMDELLAPYDALVTPTWATVAYPVDRSWNEYRRGFSGENVGGAGNAAGLPAISLPNGFGEGHLPTGLQLVGRAFAENSLLTVANAYQEKTDWHTRHPDV